MKRDTYAKLEELVKEEDSVTLKRMAIESLGFSFNNLGVDIRIILYKNPGPTMSEFTKRF